MYRDVYSCPRGVRPLWARRVGLTNRKRRKSNWRNTISRRQWSSRRIIARARARVDTRPAVLSKNYAEIGFDTFLPRSDSTQPKDSANRANRANDHSFIGETAWRR